jgi:hypothetical protein
LKRMKQRNAFLRLRVNCARLIGLVKTAVRTLKDQVFQGCQAPTAPGNNVVDMEHSNLSELLQSTIAAAPCVARKNRQAQRPWNRRQAHGTPAGGVVAFREIDMICPKWAIRTSVSNWSFSAADSSPFVFRSSNECMRSLSSAVRPRMAPTVARGSVNVTVSSGAIIY